MWFVPFVLGMLLVPRLSAQVPDTMAAAAGTTVSGIVYDSLAATPLAGAMVQLVASDDPARFASTELSDSLGRFTIRAVPDGRYLLGFFHEMLDSIGVQPPLKDVYVAGGRAIRVDLAVPSPARLRAAICGPATEDSTSAIVIGVVRDAKTGDPVAGAAVTGQWLEFSFRPGGMLRNVPRIVATTGENGWFALCNVPRDGTMEIIAGRGADSTSRLEVHVPPNGYLRRDLYVGAARIASGPAPLRDDNTEPAGRTLIGDGRLRGTVLTVAEGQPVSGAQVSIIDGPRTRTDERGEWTLANVPLGTRMLDVRSIGFYPERMPVNVVPGAPSVRTSLSTMKAVLDTVRVTAARLNANMSGFAMRRQSGTGRYLSPDDVARHQPIVTSDLFRRIPGVRLERDSLGGQVIVMRGTFAGECSPSVYVDGLYMHDIGADAIDDMVNPRQIAGIEIYPAATAPPQFQNAFGGCGSIVIWRK